MKLPLAKIRNICKHHNKDLKLGKNAELMIFMNYLFFIKIISNQAKDICIQQKQSVIHSSHINQAFMAVMHDLENEMTD
ncbi:Uncharacterised protein g7156 [Pycnogonum litorale]